jgi:chaperone modulatory protein CbpM
MITIDHLCLEIEGLRPQDIERWVGNAWVRADDAAEGYVFHEIDVARVRLIVELRDTMQVNEEALPVVLGLLDQLYDLRRELRRLATANRHGQEPA